MAGGGDDGGAGLLGFAWGRLRRWLSGAALEAPPAAATPKRGRGAVPAGAPAAGPAKAGGRGGKQAAKRQRRDPPAGPSRGGPSGGGAVGPEAAPMPAAMSAAAEIAQLRADNARLQQANAALAAANATLTAERGNHAAPQLHGSGGLPVAAWEIVVSRMLTGRDAAVLACTCRPLQGVCDRAWAGGQWQPVVGSDGVLREPASGRGWVELRPGDDLQAAVDYCRPGGAIMLSPGVYRLPRNLEIDTDAHLFGRKLATLLTLNDHAIRCTAARATLDGLTLRGRFGLHIKGDNDKHQVLVQHCDIDYQQCAVDIYAPARPTIRHNVIRSMRTGVSLGNGGICDSNDVTAKLGIFVGRVDVESNASGASPPHRHALHITRNHVHGCAAGVALSFLCPDDYELGEGNTFEGNLEGNVTDER